MFANLAYRIDPKQPLESLKVGLARLHENYRFPSDEEFRKAPEKSEITGQVLGKIADYSPKVAQR